MTIMPVKAIRNVETFFENHSLKDSFLKMMNSKRRRLTGRRIPFSFDPIERINASVQDKYRITVEYLRADVLPGAGEARLEARQQQGC